MLRERAAFADTLVQATADSAERGRVRGHRVRAVPAHRRVRRHLRGLTEVVGWFTSPIAGATDPPEVVYGELPLGPASRLRFADQPAQRMQIQQPPHDPSPGPHRDPDTDPAIAACSYAAEIPAPR